MQICLKVSVGNTDYNLTKYDKAQIINSTTFKCPKNGGYLLQNWVMKCNDRKNDGKIPIFLKPAKTSNPTGHSGASSLSPIGDNLLYIETSSSNHGNGALVSFEGTDITRISN